MLAAMAIRRGYSLTTWFKIPEQGLNSLEILAQGSAVNLAMREGSNPVFLTSARLTQPWTFPDHYPQEWLKFVDLSHCSYTLEMRDLENGEVLSQYALDRDSLHNSSRLDVAALTIANVDESRFLLDQKSSLGVAPVKLSLDPLEVTHHFGGPSRALFSVAGHAIMDNGGGTTASNKLLTPCTMSECRFVATSDEAARGLLMASEALSPACNGAGVFLDKAAQDEIGVDGYEIEKEDLRSGHCGAGVCSEDEGSLISCVGIIEGEALNSELADMEGDAGPVGWVTVASSAAIRTWLSGEEDKKVDPPPALEESPHWNEEHRKVEATTASVDNSIEDEEDEELFEQQVLRLKAMMKREEK